MKRITFVFSMLLLTAVLAGCGDPCKENVFTKLGDSLAVIGKSGLEKDQVLTARAANRASKCVESKAGEMKKKMGF